MPTLFNKVDEFWRGVGEPQNGTRVRRFMSSSSRPPLPPSSKSKSASSSSSARKKDEKLMVDGPPAQSSSASSSLMSDPTTIGKFDRNRRCYSSLALNGKSSKNKLANMGDSIVDIYEFCKSQASRRFSYQSNSGDLKAKRKASPFGGSTMSVCDYPCIREEVISERPMQNFGGEEANNNLKCCDENNSQNINVTTFSSESQREISPDNLNGDGEKTQEKQPNPNGNEE